MGSARKIIVVISFICIIMSCIAEYYFSFDSQLTGWLAYVCIFSLVAVQTAAVGKIVKILIPAFFERHSGKIYVITPIISAEVLCAMLMYNLMTSIDNNTEAFRGAIAFNLIPFAAAGVCVICQLTRRIVKRQGKV